MDSINFQHTDVTGVAKQSESPYYVDLYTVDSKNFFTINMAMAI